MNYINNRINLKPYNKILKKKTGKRRKRRKKRNSGRKNNKPLNKDRVEIKKLE